MTIESGLALPGVGLGEEAWRPALQPLPVPFRILRMPGYGERGGPGQDLRPHSLATGIVAHELDEGTLLLGHSASCQVAVHAAALSGGRVAAVVLVGPTTDPDASTWPRLVNRWLRTAVHEDPRQVPALVRQYHRTGLATMRRAMDAARRDRIHEVVPRLTCPVLVVRGRHDAICTSGWAETLAGLARHPGSEAVTLEAGAHMVPITHSAMLAETVRSRLDLPGGQSTRTTNGG
jgi:pimeloyl-ACP methyl ester carboxylesterase